jgi:hypothetical protein
VRGQGALPPPRPGRGRRFMAAQPLPRKPASPHAPSGQLIPSETLDETSGRELAIQARPLAGPSSAQPIARLRASSIATALQVASAGALLRRPASRFIIKVAQ